MEAIADIIGCAEAHRNVLHNETGKISFVQAVDTTLKTFSCALSIAYFQKQVEMFSIVTSAQFEK